jgi:hypothetical protein
MPSTSGNEKTTFRILTFASTLCFSEESHTLSQTLPAGFATVL